MTRVLNHILEADGDKISSSLPEARKGLKGDKVPLWLDLLSLTKPRLSLLVIVTCTLGAMLNPSGLGHQGFVWSDFIGCVWFTSLLVMGSCAINCFQERHIDQMMERTKNRPLPSGRISETLGLGFGLGLSSIGLLGLFTIDLSLFWLGFAACVLYVLFYTPLKRVTTHALYVGAIPGAIPPLMGWVVSGGEFGVGLFLLAALLVLWQVPHFLSIALYYKDDYQSAGIKVYPNEHGDEATVAKIIAYSFLLGFLSLWMTFVVDFGVINSAAKPISLIVSSGLVILASLGPLALRYDRLQNDRARENQQNKLKFKIGLSRWSRYYFWATIIFLPIQLMNLYLGQF